MSQSQVSAAPSGRLPDAWLRNARLASGLVLMAFVTLHLLNHALLLISLEAAEKGRAVFLLIWRNPAGTLLLYGAVATHPIVSLLALYQRRTLTMPVREWAQILLGLAIPLLIAEHVVGTRAMHALYEANDTYEFVVRSLWILTRRTGCGRRSRWSSSGRMAALASTSGCAIVNGIRAPPRPCWSWRCWFRSWRCSASPAPERRSLEWDRRGRGLSSQPFSIGHLRPRNASTAASMPALRD
ncbi:hypothetical protein MesoLj131b_17640 [Mesorhizobium sp. 131-2-5]|nr:hypothetical protein MesoLj131b_17640 [Mesorhizobium sp. 131-2-5]